MLLFLPNLTQFSFLLDYSKQKARAIKLKEWARLGETRKEPSIIPVLEKIYLNEFSGYWAEYGEDIGRGLASDLLHEV